VNPTSVMGATKRVAELLTRQAALDTGKSYVTVRFGNVLGSRGSVVLTFKRQISAGGPIIFPEQNAMILNPICAHTLTNRPVILPEDVRVKVILWTKEQGATLTLDGQVSFTLKSGDTIRVQKSRYVTTLVASPHRDYLEILRTKLGWGGLPTGNHPDAD